jgi:hypothetical protein
MPDDPTEGAGAIANPAKGPPVVEAFHEPATGLPFWTRPLSAPNRVWVLVKTPVLVPVQEVIPGWPPVVKNLGFR